jgi:hypothetical protein
LVLAASATNVDLEVISKAGSLANNLCTWPYWDYGGDSLSGRYQGIQLPEGIGRNF